MDIEAIVKRHIGRNGWSFAHDGECAEAIRAALTEQAEAYEQRIRQLEAELAESRERIRHMEAERVPEGWKLVPIRATAEMVDSVLRYANGDDLDFYGANDLRQEIAKDWELMLAAAQSAHVARESGAQEAKDV